MPLLPRFCSYCGRHESEVGPLSTRGRCAGCGDEAMLENTRQIRDHDGPAHERWLAGLARYVNERIAD